MRVFRARIRARMCASIRVDSGGGTDSSFNCPCDFFRIFFFVRRVCMTDGHENKQLRRIPFGSNWQLQQTNDMPERKGRLSNKCQGLI